MKAYARCFAEACAAITLLSGVSENSHADSNPHSARLELAEGKPLVMVMVNGKGPFRFVIDTGTSGQALVTPELADELAIPASGQVELSDPSGQGKRNVPIVLLKSLLVAGVEFTGVRAVVHALGSEEPPCQGLLALALFRDSLLTLDFPNRELRLASGSLSPDGGQFVLPYRMPAGLPIITIRFGKSITDAQIDSGGTGLSLPENLASRLKFASDPLEIGYGSSLSTRFRIKEAKLASDVSLGRYTFKQPWVEVNRAFPLVNLGASAMQTFAVTFDQKNALVRFEGEQKRIHLSTPPAPLQMQNAPQQKPPGPVLTPID